VTLGAPHQATRSNRGRGRTTSLFAGALKKSCSANAAKYTQTRAAASKRAGHVARWVADAVIIRSRTAAKPVSRAKLSKPLFEMFSRSVDSRSSARKAGLAIGLTSPPAARNRRAARRIDGRLERGSPPGGQQNVLRCGPCALRWTSPRRPGRPTPAAHLCVSLEDGALLIAERQSPISADTTSPQIACNGRTNDVRCLLVVHDASMRSTQRNVFSVPEINGCSILNAGAERLEAAADQDSRTARGAVGCALIALTGGDIPRISKTPPTRWFSTISSIISETRRLFSARFARNSSPPRSSCDCGPPFKLSPRGSANPAAGRRWIFARPQSAV